MVSTNHFVSSTVGVQIDRICVDVRQKWCNMCRRKRCHPFSKILNISVVNAPHFPTVSWCNHLSSWNLVDA